jgi:hypothetical protein
MKLLKTFLFLNSLTLGFAQAADFLPAPQVVEIAEFRLIAGADETAFLAASRALDAFLRDCDGFVARQLVRYDDGKLADLVTWANLSAAHAAMTKAEKDSRAGAYFQFIDMNSVNLRHTTVLHHSAR